jgi:membrane-bound lytic murein transglycosylase MltF
MLEVHRFDLFPRGIGEVFKEFDEHAKLSPDLAIEQHLLIQYPWPYYFFFNNRDTALAARVETGLRAMIKDGSFDAIFRKYNGADIERAKLNDRRVIRINNPFLPKDTPLDDKSLWFDPTSDKP